MSALTDTLLTAQDTLLADAQEIAATDMRAFTSLLIGAIGTLEGRARGNRIFYTSGKPGDALGMEGDLGVNQDTGDFYAFAGGTFNFLFNGVGKASPFAPIAQNAYGTHPAFTTQRQLDLWLLQNGGGGVTPAPLPTISGFLPMQGAQGSTVVLSGTNFTGATQVSINSGAVGSFTVDSATKITVVLSGSQATGKVRVTTPAGTAVSGGDFTVLSSTPVAVEIMPTAVNYWYGGGIQRPSSGSTLSAALANLVVSLNGNTSVTIENTNTGSGNILAMNGATVLGNLTTGSATLNGLDGSKLLTLLFGAQQRSFEQGEVQGCAISKITAGSTAGINFINPAPMAIGGPVVGNSISNGSGATTPQLEGWVALARAAGYGLTALGYGSAQGVVAGAQSNWPALKAWITASLAGVTKKVIIWTLGSNDALGAQGPGACSLADYMVSFRAFLNNCAADFPGIPVLVVSPIYRQNEATTNNGYGWHLQDLRDAAQAECVNRTDVFYLDGANLVDPSKLADPAHPTTAGHLDLWNGIKPALDNALVATPPETAVIWGKANNGAAVGPGIVYQAAPPAPLFGGGVNGSQGFIYPTQAGERVVIHARNQVIDRSLGVNGGTVFGITNTEQGGNFRDIRHCWYWDGTFIRVFEQTQSAPLYEASLPAGDPSFAIAFEYNKIEYILNGQIIALDTPSTIGIPAGLFWPVGSLATPGNVQGSGSHISSATIAAKTLVASGF